MALINSVMYSVMGALYGRKDEEEGQAMVEYGLLVGLISIAGLAAILLIGPQLAIVFGKVATAITLP
jgi:pilus assembly protein Flp/PilA